LLHVQTGILTYMPQKCESNAIPPPPPKNNKIK